MDMQKCTLYVRLYRNKTVDQNTYLTIGDIADLAAPSEVKARVSRMHIFEIPDTEHDGHYAVGIIDVVQKVLQEYPNADVQSIGDPDTVIHFKHKAIKENVLWEWMKVLALCVIVFAGASIAIMTYNTDTSVAKTFIILNRILTGKEVSQPIWITVPYSLGIAVGILVFFNHFGQKKLTDDPTPMQVEIQKYEKDVENAQIQSITNKRRGEP